MNPSEIDFTLHSIRKTREQGVTFLIAEHNMQILDLCDRVIVISFGQKICEGLPQEVREPHLSVLNNLKLSARLRKDKEGIDRALGVENAGCAVIP